MKARAPTRLTAGQDLVTASRRGLRSTAHALGQAIVSGRYRPGDVLPGEIEFSEELKVSRGFLREAMRVLVSKGLVDSRPKTGTRVRPQAQWHLPDPYILAWTFAAGPSFDYIRSLFDLRAAIKPAPAGVAAERRTSAELASMGQRWRRWLRTVCLRQEDKRPTSDSIA